MSKITNEGKPGLAQNVL